jgi:hypothetical protein
LLEKPKVGDAYRLLIAIHRDISISAFGVTSEGGAREKKDETNPLV